MRFCFLLFILTPIFSSRAQVISTVAGNGTCNITADGAAAINSITFPSGIVKDAVGNIYFGEGTNIRYIDNAGILHPFAGIGEQGYTGDGGPADHARLYGPESIIMDKLGNLFFVDQHGTVIRKIDGSGVISTVTGNLATGNSGDGGPLNQAQFGYIKDIAFDNTGNLYITDELNNVIRKVNTAGIISTVAGNSIAGFSGDGGLATAAQLHSPASVVPDNLGNIFISDLYNLRIRKVNAAGIISTFAGNGSIGYPGDGSPATSAGIEEALDMAVDNAGNLYVADRMEMAIRKITAAGIISTYAGTGIRGFSGDGGPANAAEIGEPYFLYMDNQENLYISLGVFCGIRKVTSCLSAIIQQPGNLSVCGNGNGWFVVKASDALTYQWQMNTGTTWNDLADNSNWQGTQTDSLQLTGASYAMSGYQFRCRIHNPCGDRFSAVLSLTVINPLSPAGLTIAADSDTVCSGTAVVFTATPVNGGTSPLYEWKKNGRITGTNSSSYIDNRIFSGDVITCAMLSNSTCISTNTASSNAVTVTVYPSPANFLPGDTGICFYNGVALQASRSFTNYTWNDNSGNSMLPVTRPGTYWLEVTDEHNCKGRDSTIINSAGCKNGIYFPTAFTPDADGNHDFFKPIIFGNLTQYRFEVFDRFGQLVFATADPGRAWDGKVNSRYLSLATYAWACTYQFEGRGIENKRGMVLLIR